jgi:signal transduction histidine kinase/ActR/RegA family two-component response regulator
MMILQANPAAIPFGVATAISGVLAVLAWRRSGMKIALAFAVMMTGEVAWAFLAMLELIAADLPVKRILCELRVAGAIIAILGLLATVLRYTGRCRWLSPIRFGALCAPALVLVVVACTNEWHHFYWLGHEEVWVNGYAVAKPLYGPGFWMHFGYCYVLVAISTVLLAEAVVRHSGVFRVQAAIMLFGVLVPWVVSIIDMTQIFGFIYMDTAAMAFAATGLAFLPGIYRFGLLDLTPVAWAAVVEGMNDPVVVIDPSGRIVAVNPAAERLTHRKSRALVGVQAARAFRAWPALADRLTRIDSNGEGALALDDPDPARISGFDARISRLGDLAQTAGWVLVLRDITELKRAEEGRVRMLKEQAARAEAEAANRAKDRFLATLSHELRTPLTPVLATVTELLDQAPTPESLRSILEMIRRNVNLEVRLIDDLLDLTRIRGNKLHLKCEVVDAHELVQRVAEICQDDLRSAELQLVLDLAARRHDIEADPIRLQQVLWNLIKNAIKFTPAGGTVTIRTCDGEEIRTGEGPSVAGLVIAVSDTGIGIEPEMASRIFGIFEQGSASRARRSGGLGLGLTISRSIVEQHGGHLVATGDGPGRGATFTLLMPRVAAPAVIPTIEPVSPAEDTPRRSLRILLVEDNADTLSYLSEILTRRGHEVRTATGVSQAMRIAAEIEIDLLISDIELPDGTGMQLMGAIRAIRPVAGIALSGFGSSDDIELSRSAGFEIHLVKPVELHMLEEAIDQATASLRARSERVVISH